MTQVYNENMIINQTLSNIALEVNQSGSGRAVQIDMEHDDSALRVRKGATGSGTNVILINTGTGYNFYAKQNGNNHCALYENNGSGYCALYTQNSNSPAIVVNQQGGGTGVAIGQAGAGTGLSVLKTHTGSNNAISISNAGSGNDVSADSWSVSATGEGRFTSINACPGLVNAKNTAVAGGRVHIYSRSETIRKSLYCDWGMAEVSPVKYGESNSFGLSGMVDLYFAEEIQCPIINIQPWWAGYYAEVNAPSWDFPTNPLITGSKSIEANVLGLIPGTMEGCAQGVHLVFSYCEWGEPANQGEYVVSEEDPPSYYSDLVFDFQVLGCPCEILL